MGGKSDNMKFSTEIPALCALSLRNRIIPNNLSCQSLLESIDESCLENPENVKDSIKYAFPIAMEKGESIFRMNYEIFTRMIEKLKKFLKENDYPAIGKVYWQATETDRADPMRPSDIVFVNHPIARNIYKIQ